MSRIANVAAAGVLVLGGSLDQGPTDNGRVTIHSHTDRDVRVYVQAEEGCSEFESSCVDGVALSSSTHFHRLAVRHLVDDLKGALPGVGIWVGGPAFAHDRAGWADDELLDLDTLLGDTTRAGVGG